MTLPYFIPMPVGFGTLGAFIQLKEPMPDRRKLFDIGVAGPLAGLALALPLLIYGLSTSPSTVPPPNAGVHASKATASSLSRRKWLIFGQILPNPVTGEDVFMNQVTFAAWIGLLVTALNLLPVGQLDGGHTVFALFGRKARYINLATMGVHDGAWRWPACPAFRACSRPGECRLHRLVHLAGADLLLIGVEHPPALDDVTRLDTRRRLIGYLVIIIFILTFVPVPMRVIG